MFVFVGATYAAVMSPAVRSLITIVAFVVGFVGLLLVALEVVGPVLPPGGLSESLREAGTVTLVLVAAITIGLLIRWAVARGGADPPPEI